MIKGKIRKFRLEESIYVGLKLMHGGRDRIRHGCTKSNANISLNILDIKTCDNYNKQIALCDIYSLYQYIILYFKAH